MAADFPDIQVGKIYKIIDGDGVREVGVCEDKRESGFGFKWGLVAGHWKLSDQLEEVDPNSP